MQIVVTLYRRDAEGCQVGGDAQPTDSQLRDLEDSLANCANDWIEENELDRAGGLAARCMPGDRYRWALLCGDPRGGLEVIGPFPTQDDAEERAGRWEDTDWWPVEIREHASGESPEATDG